jgi:hypothetical protein
MTSPDGIGRRLALVIAALGFALLSAFFVFYTARLLYVTKGLTVLRADGKGAYLGAVVFPLLALLFGWGGWRCARAVRRRSTPPAT